MRLCWLFDQPGQLKDQYIVIFYIYERKKKDSVVKEIKVKEYRNINVWNFERIFSGMIYYNAF